MIDETLDHDGPFNATAKEPMREHENVLTGMHPPIAGVTGCRSDLTHQLQEVEDIIEQSHIKRREFQEIVAQNESSLQQYMLEETSLAHMINQRLLQKQLDQISYVDAELSQLRDFQSVVDQLLRNKAAQLDAIQFEIASRERQSDELLSSLLNCVAKGDSTTPLAGMIQSGQGGKTEPQRSAAIMDAIKQKRRIREKNARLDHANYVKELNRQRLQLSERRKCLQVQLGIVSEEVPEILSLGEQYDGGGLSSIVEQVRTTIPTQRVLLQKHQRKLHDDLELTQRLHRTHIYGGELGPSSYSSWERPQYYAMKHILMKYILPPIIDRICIEHVTSEDIDKQAELLKTAETSFHQQKIEQTLQLEVFRIWNELIDEEAIGSLTSIAADLFQVKANIFSTLRDLALLAIKHKRDMKKYIANGVEELIVTRRRFARDKSHVRFYHMNMFVPRSVSEETRIQSKATRKSRLFSLHRDKPAVNVSDVASKEKLIEAHLKDIEKGVVIYAQHGTPSLRVNQDDAKLEGLYCAKWDVEIEQMTGKGANGYAFIRGSPNGSVFLAASLDGSLQLIGIESKPDLSSNAIRYICKPQRKRAWKCIDTGPWSMLNQILSLTESGSVALWSAHRLPNEALLSGELNPDDLGRYHPGISVPAPVIPTIVAMHSAVGFDLSTPSFLIGTLSGEIIRWNTHKIGKLLLTGKPPALPTQLQSIYSKKEYYRGHRSRVIFLGFLSHSSRTDDLSSIDSEGNLIFWETERLSGFDWILPKKHYHIEVVDGIYDDFNGARTDMLFPLSDDADIDWANYERIARNQLVKLGYRESIHGQFDPPYVSGAGSSLVWRHRFKYERGGGQLYQHERFQTEATIIRGRVVQAKTVPAKTDIILLTWMPASKKLVPHMSFFLCSISPKFEATISSPIFTMNVRRGTNKFPNEREVPMWQITQVFDPPGTDFLLVLPYMARSISIVSITTGATVIQISLNSSPMLTPRDMTLFRQSTRIAVVYEESPLIEVWTLVDRNDDVARRQFSVAFRRRSTRLQSTPIEHRVRHSSTVWGFGKPENVWFDLDRKIRQLIVDIGNSVAAGSQWMPRGTPQQY